LIATSQIRSLLFSILLVFAAVFWMLRSFWQAGVAIVPVCLAVLWNYGIMGWIGMPLGVATSMFSAIALGTGVDLAIHWLAAFRLQSKLKSNWIERICAAARLSGSGIMVNAVVLLLGFAVLTLSACPPNRRLGILMVVNLLGCLFSTIVILPAATAIAFRLGLIDVTHD
jgi:predicted RND superfamily exporter protein